MGCHCHEGTSCVATVMNVEVPHVLPLSWRYLMIMCCHRGEGTSCVAAVMEVPHVLPLSWRCLMCCHYH